MIRAKINKFFKELRFYMIIILVAIVFAIVLRVFVVAPIIKIPSDSMDPVVMAGDYIIVTKLIPGPRVYRDIRQIRVDGKVQTKRFKGIRKAKRNDVLVFNFPYTGRWDRIDMDVNVFYLKRCVALPGDTFSIENGIYRVNSGTDLIGCTFRQRELFQKSQNDFSSVIWQCFPYDTVYYQWNIKDFGPLFVPASGSAIAIDTLNFMLYKNLIEYETDKVLSVHDSSIYLDEDRISSYTFKLNYYFMAGDYIYNSRDSRYWGLLPEDCIIGKAMFVWRSTDIHYGKIQWNRFFKTIR
jgi:signal peptidase I